MAWFVNSKLITAKKIGLEARDTVRKLRFFQRVLNDIDKAEDQLLDEEDSFDLDDDF